MKSFTALEKQCLGFLRQALHTRTLSFAYMRLLVCSHPSSYVWASLLVAALCTGSGINNLLCSIANAFQSFLDQCWRCGCTKSVQVDSRLLKKSCWTTSCLNQLLLGKMCTCCMHFCFSLSDFTSTQVHEGARPDLCTVWPFDTWILSSIVSSHILELLCLSTECGGDGGSKSPVEISINILKCVMKCLAPAMWLPSSSQIVLK